MKKYLLGATASFMCVAATIVPSTAATLDDVMARLNSLQRDNQAMRKEIAALRQKEQRSAAPQAVDTRNAPSRQLSPAASSAMAADFPVKGRHVEPLQAFTWSGFYLGAHAGYGWGSNDWRLISIIESPTTFGSPVSPETNGVLGGIQAGANLQIQNWVVGIEADLAFMHADGRDNGTIGDVGIAVIPGANTIGRSQIDWLATFTGRWGYAFDRSLFYVKGGVAAAGYTDNMSFTTSAPIAPSFNEMGTKDSTRVGWIVGAGWEYAFAPNWSAKIEYNYLDFGTTTETFQGSVSTGGLPLSFQQEIEHTLHLVKAGVNYRF